MENDLYWYCPKCGREVKVHPDAARSLRLADRVVSSDCECGHSTPVCFADCTERRAVMWEVDGVPVPVCRPHDSGATVNATDEIEKWKDQLAIVLKERNDFESGFAAMTKERDGLAATLKQAVADCNEARAEVERLKGEVRELKIKCEQRRRDCVEFAGELRVAEEDERVARDENAALRARIAALEALSKAQSEHAHALHRVGITRLNVTVASLRAGHGQPRIAEENS